MTNWAQICTGLLFYAYDGIHTVRTLVFDNYQMCTVPLKFIYFLQFSVMQLFCIIYSLGVQLNFWKRCCRPVYFIVFKGRGHQGDFAFDKGTKAWRQLPSLPLWRIRPGLICEVCYWEIIKFIKFSSSRNQLKFKFKVASPCGDPLTMLLQVA